MFRAVCCGLEPGNVAPTNGACNKMSTRVHVCSVERASEPDLGSKLLRLSTACEEIVISASTMNSNVRCTVNGAYLNCAKMTIIGFSHVDDRVMDKLTIACESEFGQDMVGVELMKHGTPSICISCSFGAEPQERATNALVACTSSALFVTLAILALAFLATNYAHEALDAAVVTLSNVCNMSDACMNASKLIRASSANFNASKTN